MARLYKIQRDIFYCWWSRYQRRSHMLPKAELNGARVVHVYVLCVYMCICFMCTWVHEYVLYVLYVLYMYTCCMYCIHVTMNSLNSALYKCHILHQIVVPFRAFTNHVTVVYHVIGVQNYPRGRAGERAGKLPYLFLLMARQRHMEHFQYVAQGQMKLYDVKLFTVHTLQHTTLSNIKQRKILWPF